MICYNRFFSHFTFFHVFHCISLFFKFCDNSRLKKHFFVTKEKLFIRFSFFSYSVNHISTSLKIVTNKVREFYVFFSFVKHKIPYTTTYIIIIFRMKHDRIERAQKVSHKLISEFLVSELDDHSADFALITLTSTKISHDLSYIDVYVSSLKKPEWLTKYLSEYAPKIHKLLCKKIDFLKVPKVRFRYDNSGKESHEIYSTIKEVNEYSEKK